MRASRATVLLALLSLAGCRGISGTIPAETIPDAVRPDGTPIERPAARPAVRRVEVPPPPPGFHLAVRADLQRLTLSATEGPFALPTATPTLFAVDATLQRAEGLGPGVILRVIRGVGPVPHYMEGGLLVGTRRFAVDAAVATRKGPDIFRGGAYDSLFAFVRVGVRTDLALGRTGFAWQARVGHYLDFPAPGTVEKDMRGWSADSWLRWSAPRSPLTLNIGYRTERFLVRDRHQTSSGFALGSGFILGRR